MLIEDIPKSARAKLVVIRKDAKLIEAARFLSSGTDFLVVQDARGVIQGVVTRTDVVRQISSCRGASCLCPVSKVMTHEVVMCHGQDRVQDVALRMKARSPNFIPVVDDNNRTLRVLTSRSVLRALLGGAEDSEAQLVDYVSGVGYR